MVGYIVCSKLRVFLLAIFIGITLQVVTFICPNVGRALTLDMVWSWTDHSPSVYESTVTTGDEISWCQFSYQTREIDGETSPREACVNEGEKMSFGIYYNGGFPAAVSFAGDNKMHRVWGICGEYNSCLYLPGTDTLVTKQYLVNNIVRSLVVYKNFSKRISPTLDGPIPSISYTFDSSNPDYVFRSEVGLWGQPDGYAWPVGGLNASKNGKWLAIEFRQRGIGLLNIETLEMRRVSTLAFSYGTGYDPTSELDVSDDGRHVVIMGINSGLTIFDVGSDCGDEATNDRMQSVLPIANPCKTSPIDYEAFITRFYKGVRPVFSADGGELSFYASSYTGEMRHVILRASGYFSPKLLYLALGDSFSSGEGDESDGNYYTLGTDDEYEKCHLSMRSYPYLIANMLSMSPDYMKSVACSGAMTVDVVGSDDNYWGQGDRLSTKGSNLDLPQKTSAQVDAMDKYLPGRVHQISFVKASQPAIITIGIGGNDAGFMEKLKACVGPGTCSWANNAKDKEKTAAEIKRLFDPLVQTYLDLRSASPYSQIYAIGYPKVISTTGECDALTGYLLDASERQFMNEGIIYLNQVIAAAALNAGIKYVDVQESFGSSVLCGSEEPSAMNAVRTGDDASPIDKANWFKIIGQESFHPNSLGHADIANAIVASVDILHYDYCSFSFSIPCRELNSAPDPSSYWGVDKSHNYPAQKVTSFVSNPDDKSDIKQKHLALGSGSLAANSDVRVEISSEPQLLGQFKAAADGSFDADVMLPTNLEDGYHTIHLYGTSNSGEAVDLYQVISYMKPTVVDDEPPQSETTVIDSDGAKGTTGSTEKVVSKSEVAILGTAKATVLGVNDTDNNFIEQLSAPFTLPDDQAVAGVSTTADKSNSPVDNSGSVNRVGSYLVIGTFCAIIIAAMVAIARRARKTSGK